MSRLLESGVGFATEGSLARELESFVGATAITDNFDRANGAPGSDWTEHSVGSWLIASNKLARQAGGLDEIIHNTALSSDNHYVEADLVGTSTEYVVLAARWNGSLTSSTLYECFLHPTAGTIRIGKLVANTETILSSVTFAHGNAHKLRFEVEGTALRGYVDGVLAISVTDSSITTGKQVGLYSSHISITATVDNFAADIIGAVTPPAGGPHWTDTTFTGINGGGSYDTLGTFGTSVAGEVYESTGFSNAFARRTDAPLTNNQYVKITVEDLDAEYFLGVRHPSPVSLRMGYWCEYHGDFDQVYWYKDNVFAGNPSVASVSGAGTLELRCVANVCTLYRNGTSIASNDFSASPVAGTGYTGFGAINGSATKSITDAEGGDYP